VLERQPVTGLDLDGRDAFSQQRLEARARAVKERLFAGGARGGHGGSDSAACPRDLLITGALKPQVKFGGALAGIDQVRVRIDQSRCNQRTAKVMLNIDIPSRAEV